MSAPGTVYRGRFAPSPTGPLHMGSLVAALASYLDARHQRGTWLVRMEDLDPPREQAGAAQAIIDSLTEHGLEPDEPIAFQGHRSALYDNALEQLMADGKAFPCQCSRATLAGQPHHGRCQVTSDAPHALRALVPPGTRVALEDGLQGHQDWDVHGEAGDFVIRRKDNLYAYQLAVVVDDADQGITHIVRGADLLDSTPRQVFLQRQLGLPTPVYLHLPVLVNRDDQKLSKQTHAPALDGAQAQDNLRHALAYLDQPTPPADLLTPAAILHWAIPHWRADAIPRVGSLPANEV